MANDIYKRLLEIRKSKDLKLNPNPYLKPEVKLRYYQVQGVIHLFALKRIVLGDDTGLGKTAQVISAYTTLLSKDPSQKLIVICPSSAIYQWASEFEKFTTGVRTRIVESVDIKVTDENGKTKKLSSFDSRAYQFKQFQANDAHVLIFNYNTMISDFHVLQDLAQKYKFMVVFDEATAFKNPKTHTYKYASELVKISDRAVALSATIIKNGLIEAWAIYSVIMPGLLGSELMFKKNYCIMEKIQLWKGRGQRGKVIQKIKAYKNLEHFKQAIDPYFLGRKKNQVANELPEINTIEVKVKLSPEQQEIYDDAVKGFLDFGKFDLGKVKTLFLEGDEPPETEDEFGAVKYIDKLTALIYCQQICNSPHTIGIEAPSSKEAELLRLLETELKEEKVVIYTRFKKMVDRLEHLITDNLGMKVLKITGDISNKDREISKTLFNTSPENNVIIINSAAKEAVNLQSSGYLVFYDLPFSYGDFLQIIGRIHRIGSTHDKIFLIYLICRGTIDEKVYDVLASKKNLFDAVLGDSAVGAIDAKAPATVSDLFNEILEDAKKIKSRN